MRGKLVSLDMLITTKTYPVENIKKKKTSDDDEKKKKIKVT